MKEARLPRKDQNDFDEYRLWLGVPRGLRPPTHYQLLGISSEETDVEVIHAAALRQSAYVRNFQSGEHSATASRVLGELAKARAVLTDPERRLQYDSSLSRSSSKTYELVCDDHQSKSKSDSRTVARPPRHKVSPAAIVIASLLVLAVSVVMLVVLQGMKETTSSRKGVASEVASTDAAPQNTSSLPSGTQPRPSTAEVSITVYPPFVTVTVIDGPARIVGEGGTRTIQFDAFTDPLEKSSVASFRFEAPGYESLQQSIRFSAVETPQTVTIRLMPVRHWLLEQPLTGWDAVNPKQDVDGHSFIMRPPSTRLGYASAMWKVKDFRTFHASVGFPKDYERDPASAVVFAVFGDGRPLWMSRELHAGHNTDICVCDVRGVQVLELRVRSAGAASWAHATWIDPHFVVTDDFGSQASPGQMANALPQFQWNETEGMPPATQSPPALVPLFKVITPLRGVLTIDKAEVALLKDKYPGAFDGGKGHHVSILGFVATEEGTGLVPLWKWTHRKTDRFAYAVRTPATDNNFRSGKAGVWEPSRTNFWVPETVGANTIQIHQHARTSDMWIDWTKAHQAERFAQQFGFNQHGPCMNVFVPPRYESEIVELVAPDQSGTWTEVPNGGFEYGMDGWSEKDAGLHDLGRLSISNGPSFRGRNCGCLLHKQNLAGRGFGWYSTPQELTLGEDYVLSACFLMSSRSAGKLWVELQMDGRYPVRIEARNELEGWHFVSLRFVATVPRVRVLLAREGYNGTAIAGIPSYADCIAITRVSQYGHRRFRPPAQLRSWMIFNIE